MVKKSLIAVEAGRSSLLKVRSLYPSLAKVHKRIADGILADPKQIVSLPVTELAKMVGVSEASIVLFCKKLGFRGYHDLKIALSEEVFSNSADIHEQIDRDDDTDTIVKKVFNTSIQALKDSLQLVDTSAVEAAAQAIHQARRVFIIGASISGVVAKDFWMKLFRVDIDAHYYDSPTTMQMATAIARPDDLVFAISHSGSTTAVIDAVATARARGAATVGLTNYLNSPLTHVVDIVLLTSSRETGIREEEMTSRIAQLAVIDSVFVTLGYKYLENASECLRITRAAVSGEKI